MQAGDTLVLRDIHLAPVPSWWPPAPGWWWLAALVLCAVAGVAGRAWLRHRRRLRVLVLFDREVGAAGSPAEELAAISGLLRRAARRNRPGAETLRDDDWLQLVAAGRSPPRFDADALALLRDGAWRPDVDAAAVAALRQAARARFAEWMQR